MSQDKDCSPGHITDTVYLS